MSNTKPARQSASPPAETKKKEAEGAGVQSAPVLPKKEKIPPVKERRRVSTRNKDGYNIIIF